MSPSDQIYESEFLRTYFAFHNLSVFEIGYISRTLV